MFKISSEGVSLLHYGDLGHVPDEKTLEKSCSIDILMVPVGGTYTLDPQLAIQFVKKIDPSIVIPMHFQNKDLDMKEFAGLQPLSDFLRLMGQTDVTQIPKLSVKHEDFVADTSAKVVLLQSST